MVRFGDLDGDDGAKLVTSDSDLLCIIFCFVEFWISDLQVKEEGKNEVFLLDSEKA